MRKARIMRMLARRPMKSVADMSKPDRKSLDSSPARKCIQNSMKRLCLGPAKMFRNLWTTTVHHRKSAP